MLRWVRRVGRGRGIRYGELETGDDSDLVSALRTGDATCVLLGFSGTRLFSHFD